MVHEHSRTTTRRGVSLIEVITVLTVLGVALTVTVPSLGYLRDASGIEQSKSNLVTLSIAHATYAADNNNRQYTTWPDNFSAYGGSYTTALQNLNPGPLPIGWNEQGYWQFTTIGQNIYSLRTPISFEAGVSLYFGAFRAIDSCEDFNAYVNGRFYDPVFYAPNDAAPMEVTKPFFDTPWSFEIPASQEIYWSSYVRSPAALFNPQVFRRPSEGGYRDPFLGWSIGLTTPSLHAAAYPDLKTHIIEHHWLQNAPADYCNPAFPIGSYDGCEPYYFNHSIDSEPATLFYDGHVRLLPNSEVQAGDQTVLMQTRGEDGLWSRDTPYGSDGYLLEFAHDMTVDVSHHILTTDGILGRDTLGPLSQTKPNDNRARGSLRK